MEIIKNSFLINKFSDAVWFIKPERLRTMSSFLLGRVNDPEKMDKSLALLQLEDKKKSAINIQREGSTAVLNIEGVMVPKCSWLDSMCGFISTLELNMKFNELLEDNSVREIILYFDSPGGETTAVMEFAETVYSARNEKVIKTFTDTCMCSAAYFVGSASSEIICTPSAVIGSIGVYISLVKYIGNELTDGDGDKFQVHYIQAGDNKLFGNQFTELTETEKNYFQTAVDKMYDKFVSHVAKYRGVDKQIVIDTQGSHYDAADAPEWMVDTLADYKHLI